MKKQNSPPDALLLMGTHCPYCPTVLQELRSLESAGVIGRVETVNIEEHPEIAREMGVRSVPWVRIGPFELEGLRSGKELGEWAEKAGTVEGMTRYLNELLTTGKIDKALKLFRADPAMVTALLSLFSDPDTALNTRIGISAIMEHLEGSDLINGMIDHLGKLTGHQDARIRGDACHYLGLTGNRDAIDYIKPLLDDNDDDVRELAQESMKLLGS